MKKIFAILMILSICAVGRAATDSNITTLPDSNTSVDCQGKIKQLERTIESLRKRLDKILAAYSELKKENEQLKNLLPKEKTDPNIKSTANFDPNNGIVYRGKTRNKQWFNMMYDKFRDKICAVDGKYHYITGSLSTFSDGLARPDNRLDSYEDLNVSSMTWPIGTLVRYGRYAEVISVLGDGEVLIWDGGKYSGSPMICHIKGLDGKFADSQEIPKMNDMRFIYVGTFEYTAANSGHKTVPSLVVYKPLTKRQFAEAINSGFELINENKQPVP
jgi:regulator of replication initiation timing